MSVPARHAFMAEHALMGLGNTSVTASMAGMATDVKTLLTTVKRLAVLTQLSAILSLGTISASKFYRVTACWNVRSRYVTFQRSQVPGLEALIVEDSVNYLPYQLRCSVVCGAGVIRKGITEKTATQNPAHVVMLAHALRQTVYAQKMSGAMPPAHAQLVLLSTFPLTSSYSHRCSLDDYGDNNDNVQRCCDLNRIHRPWLWNCGGLLRRWWHLWKWRHLHHDV